MDNKILKETLEYCLANLKHPEAPMGYVYNAYITDGYYAPAQKTAEQIKTDLENHIKTQNSRIEKIAQFEKCVENLKFFINNL